MSATFALGGVEALYRRTTAAEKRRSVMEAYADCLNSDEHKVIAFPTQPASGPRRQAASQIIASAAFGWRCWIWKNYVG